MTKSQSKIEKLIEDLCPNGVELRKLGQLEDGGVITLGRGCVISKKDIADIPGHYPVYSSSAAGSGEFGRYGKYMFDDERISWSIDGGGRFFYRPAQKYSVTNVSGWLKVNNPKAIDTKYLYYVLSNAWGTKIFNYVKKAHPSVIRDEYEVPIPPLKIQKAIVEALDNFIKLEAELEAELEARQKQYAHYSAMLLTFREDVEFKELNELGHFYGGLTGKSKEDFTDGNAKFITYMNIFSNIAVDTDIETFVKVGEKEKQNKIQYGDVLFTGSSETPGECGMSSVLTTHIDEPLYLNSFSFGFRINEPGLFLPDFLKHLFRGERIRTQIAKTASGVTRFNVSKRRFAKIQIPLPSLETQKRIAGTLDKFESLISDISSGLPAELSARRKQYEYYRGKLLTFPEHVD